MTAPLKPWERAGVNSRAFGGDIGTSMSTNMSAPGVSGSGGSSLGPTIPTTLSAGPPLPPRAPGTALDNNSSGFGYRTGATSYSSPYSSTGYGNTGYGSYGSYSGYGSYGGYGGYGSGYGGYGGYNSFGSYGGLGSYGRPYGSTDNRFVAVAEESSQPAFQSLESIVQAFGSISMMLDSTLNAVYSSFRAVLGMADQFSRLRSHLGKVFSALAIFRTAKWAYMRLLYLLGLSRQNPNDAAWSKAIAGAGSTAAELLTEADIKKPRSSWPITLFMAIIISAPYFIWRIISSLDKPSTGITDKAWADGLTEHYTAQADYDFNAANPQELSFKAGQTLRLAPRSLQPRITGWLLAAVDKQRIGLVPSNYIRILSKNDGSGAQ